MEEMEEMEEMDSSSLKKQVVHNLLSVVRLHRKRVEQSFADGELYGSQHRLLMDIARLLGPDRQAVLSQTELAKRIEVTTATVAAALKKLEKGGYIRKIMDADDNR
ncbi:MAG: MarR family transcriptional regulator [Lachnospiraceae bacterium]|nr:MarR family transcriptional regulator [Lachnospiraceae bacterium]